LELSLRRRIEIVPAVDFWLLSRALFKLHILRGQHRVMTNSLSRAVLFLAPILMRAVGCRRLLPLYRVGQPAQLVVLGGFQQRQALRSQSSRAISGVAHESVSVRGQGLFMAELR
jgi:hypothetical protein